MKYLLFDIESSGLNPLTCFVISNGAIIYDDETQEVNKFYNLLNWKIILGDKFTTQPTQHIHKISDEELIKDGIDPIDAFSDFYDFIHKYGGFEVAVAFNIAFDHNFYLSNFMYILDNITETRENCDKLDKIQKLKDIFYKTYDLDDKNNIIFFDSMIYDRLYHFEVDYVKVHHNLNDVGLRYNIPEDINAHNALADTERTLKIFKLQLEEMKENNIEIDRHLEIRMIKKYIRDQAKYASSKRKNNSDNLDYLGANMKAASFK